MEVPATTPPPEHRADPADPRQHLVRAQLKPLWRFLRLLGCTTHEADDLTQETLVVALQRQVFDGDDPRTGAFLRGTARHLFLRRRHQQGRRAALFADAAELLWQRRCGDRGGDREVAALRRCIEQLHGRPHQAVRLFYGEGWSRARVATALALKENGIKTLLQRVRATLRECLERTLT